MARVTVRDKIAPYIEQGLSAIQIRDITGLNYKEVIDWINKHGNMNIRY